jgi:hypothetical protein
LACSSSRGKGRETAGIAAAAAGRRGRGEEERKGGRKLTGGTQPSARAKKRKKRERAWAGAGKGWRAAGPLGPKGKEGLLSLFSFLFQTPFKTTFLFKFKSNSFKLFLKNFINFLETTQATKNHASQLMMHNHLLSLCLLNYV